MSTHPTLRLVSLTLISGFGLAAALVLPRPAEACRVPEPASAYSMEVLVGGRPLALYNASGTRYVEAQKGREYAIRLTNRTGLRVAVALAVDGLNSIDARHTSALEARKWILAPWETVTLSGWQTSSGTARRFVFTSEPKSYGAWLGRTDDLGVISAAFFRELRPSDAITSDAAPTAPSLEGRAKRADADAGAAARNRELKSQDQGAQKDEMAATGIGREIEHRVIQVDFEEESSPSSVLNVRYEYHDALVRLGVLPGIDEPLARRERARGFSEPGFAPVPF